VRKNFSFEKGQFLHSSSPGSERGRKAFKMGGLLSGAPTGRFHVFDLQLDPEEELKIT
jgi:hypothetical protein